MLGSPVPWFCGVPSNAHLLRRPTVAIPLNLAGNIKGSGVFDLLRLLYAPIVAVAVSLQGPVSPRVFTQRSM